MDGRGERTAEYAAEAETPNWWVANNRRKPDPPSGYAEMIEALRALQQQVATAVPDTATAHMVIDELHAISRRLQPFTVADEWSRLSGFIHDIPGRGQALIPPIHVDEATAHRFRGRLRYGDYYIGGNGAVHGGAVPLVFDDILGRLANSGGRSVSRTAYLHVDFRSVTPVGRVLTVEAWFEREEGRKRFIRGTLHDGERLCAEAHGLFVQLRAGQP